MSHINIHTQSSSGDLVKMVDAAGVSCSYSKRLRLLICSLSFSLGGSAGKCHDCSQPLKSDSPFVVLAHNQCKGQEDVCKE